MPAGPCGLVCPAAPVSPLRLWNAKVNVLAEAVPSNVTLTDGVSVEESTEAVAPVMVASTPSEPCQDSGQGFCRFLGRHHDV